MKNSPFDIKQQNSKIENKIVVGLERISEAFRVLLWEQSKTNGLSPIQIQLLIFILYHPAQQCKVSYLADEFNMSKATISDSIKILVQKELLHKVQDTIDTRSYELSITEKGKSLAQMSALFTEAIEQPLLQLSFEQKENLLNSLMQIINTLNKNGVITVQRMCFNCAHYESNLNGHYCNFLKKKLQNADLRVDCPEHEISQ